MFQFSTLIMDHDGHILEELLKELSIKKSGLAEKLNKSNNTITNWVQSDKISNDNLIEIGKALRVDMTRRFPRLKVLPEAAGLNYFNSDPEQLVKDLAMVKEAKTEYENKRGDFLLEIQFLKDRVSAQQELIDAKNQIISGKDEVIKSRDQKIAELEKELSQLK